MIVWILKALEALLGKVVIGNVPEEKKTEIKKKMWGGFIQILEALAEAGAKGVTEGMVSEAKGKYTF